MSVIQKFRLECEILRAVSFQDDLADTAATSPLYVQSFRSFCKIDSFPRYPSVSIVYIELSCRFTMLSFFRIMVSTTICLNSPVDRLIGTPLGILVQVLYHTCLTNGVQFTTPTMVFSRSIAGKDPIWGVSIPM